MGKNVAVFVDVANIFYAAKAAGVDIDYVTLLKSATAGRDFVRAYAYTGLDPDNENQRNFHQFLARHQYKVVSKDIRKYGDGKVKANLDIELVVDMMKTARNLDVAVIVSGDGDFASAIRAVQEMGVRVEVISFRGNTSSDLIEVADLFTDITQIAKVDKTSTRSGRRVADDDEDLSMTEVPDKLSEGTGRGRGRGRGRGGRYEREETPVAASRGRGRSSTAVDAVAPIAAVAAGSTAGLVALPGEKLSRASRAAAPAAEAVADLDIELELDPEEAEGIDGAERVEGEGADADGRRRRRRRGGRGRGRGRRDGVETTEGGVAVEGGDDAAPDGDEDDAEPVAAEAEAPVADRARRAPRTPSGELPTPFDDLDALQPARRPQRSTPFGSVWDRQLGTSTPSRSATSGAASPAPLPDDEEELDEPAIPEYLLSERRGQGRGGAGGGQGRGSGNRGGNRSAYAAAIDRERYGGGRGAGANRFTEQPTRRSSPGGGSPVVGGSNRGGTPPARAPRTDRPDRFDRAPRGGGDEPWSEVPPELEAMLRAQQARSRPAEPARPVGRAATPAPVAETAPAAEAPKRRVTRKVAPAETAPVAEAAAPAAEAPKRRVTRKVAPAEAAPVAETAPAEAEAPKRRVTRKVAPAETAPVAEAAAPAAGAPKRRVTRKPAEAAPVAETAPAAEAPKRRVTRKVAPAEG